MSQLWVRLSQIEVEKLKAVEEAVHCRCTALHCGAGGEEEGRREERMTVEEERMSVEEERMTVEGERDEVARLGEEAAREMEGAKNPQGQPGQAGRAQQAPGQQLWFEDVFSTSISNIFNQPQRLS